MSSGFRIDPSSPANLDYGRGNEDSLNENEGSNSSSAKQKSYIDRSDSSKGRDKTLEMRKARKKDKGKKKKISERATKEFNEEGNEDQADD